MYSHIFVDVNMVGRLLSWFLDPTDIHIRHSLANVVACALGTHESTIAKTSHLWTLTFAPETLKGTYLAGYMVTYLYNVVI